MKLLQVATLQEAKSSLKTLLQAIPRQVEERPISAAAGCTLAQDILAPENIPAFRRSAVDGYAVLSGDTHGASDSIPVFLEVVEEVSIGQAAASTLTHGQCAYVPTGGMLPAGADSMVMVEYCELFSANSVAVNQAVACGNYVVYPGDDMKKGSLVLPAGSKLRFQEIGALAAMGIDTVKVYKPFTVTIVSTGDELAPLSAVLKNGQVYDSNAYALAVQAKAAGMEVIARTLIGDEESSFRQVVQKAMRESDFVITSGGSSQGKKDMTERLFNELSRDGVFLHGLALKPGKPTLLAWSEENRAVLVGLPGHPIAASTVFALLIAPLIRGEEAAPQAVVAAKMAVNLASAPGRETCLPVRLHPTPTGYEAQPVFGRSGLWSTLTRSDGYLLIDKNKEGLKAGETVQVHLWER